MPDRTMFSYSFSVVGYHDSSFSTCPWLAWWVRWLIRQPWYGTRIDEWTMLPIKLLSCLLLLKLPWPLHGNMLAPSAARTSNLADTVQSHSHKLTEWEHHWGNTARQLQQMHAPVVADHEERPEHGALSEPVSWPYPPVDTMPSPSDHCM